MVFSDDGVSKHPLLRFLEPGFRHVFCCVLDKGSWLRVDSELGVPTVEYLTGEDFDLARHYRDNGLTVVETKQGTRTPRSPAIQSNCVGLVKSILCIRSPLAITPYGLYKHLKGAS